MDVHATNGTNGTSAAAKAPKLLWKHPDPESTPMWGFLQHVNKTYNLQLNSYDELLAWSTEHIADFWGEMWETVSIRAAEKYKTVSSSTLGFAIPLHTYIIHTKWESNKVI